MPNQNKATIATFEIAEIVLIVAFILSQDITTQLPE